LGCKSKDSYYCKSCCCNSDTRHNFCDICGKEEHSLIKGTEQYNGEHRWVFRCKECEDKHQAYLEKLSQNYVLIMEQSKKTKPDWL